jgi:5'-nucleotidase
LTLLQPSANVRYAFDPTRPSGQRLSEVRIDGRPLDPDGTYRVATNSFLAVGGDGFATFKRGTSPIGGMLDLDAFEAYLAGPAPIAPPVPHRTKNLAPAK